MICGEQLGLSLENLTTSEARQSLVFFCPEDNKELRDAVEG